MADTWRVSDNVVPICPDCQADLTFVCSWPSRGTWGYDVVHTYECPTHGPIFITPETSVGGQPAECHATAPDQSDRDSLIAAPRKPAPVLNTDAIAVPEPDPGPDSN
jgi:hypothetical protein